MSDIVEQEAAIPESKDPSVSKNMVLPITADSETKRADESNSSTENINSSNDNNDASNGTSSKQASHSANEFVCKWIDCNAREYPTLTALVDHLNSKHLAHMAHLTPTTPVRYTCQWEGCPRFGIEQPSRFALISHCRTHTGEKPYFCPIPECEKHFTRSDALAKHVKGVHDLHSAKDALALIKDKVKKNKMEPFVEDHENLAEYDYLALIEEDYEFKNPWWFSKSFIDTIKDENRTLGSIYNLPFDAKQFKIASNRYEAYLNDEEDAVMIDNENSFQQNLNDKTKEIVSEYSKPIDRESVNIDGVDDLDELINIHNKLKQKLLTATNINKIVSSQLSKSVKEKRKLWLINQILIDSNIVLGLPNENGSVIADEQKVTLDRYDEELLQEPKHDEQN